MRIPQTICVKVRVIENDFNLKVFLFILLKITQQGQPPLKLIIQVDYLQMLQYFVHNFKIANYCGVFQDFKVVVEKRFLVINQKFHRNVMALMYLQHSEHIIESLLQKLCVQCTLLYAGPSVLFVYFLSSSHVFLNLFYQSPID